MLKALKFCTHRFASNHTSAFMASFWGGVGVGVVVVEMRHLNVCNLQTCLTTKCEMIVSKFP